MGIKAECLFETKGQNETLDRDTVYYNLEILRDLTGGIAQELNAMVTAT